MSLKDIWVKAPVVCVGNRDVCVVCYDMSDGCLELIEQRRGAGVNKFF